MTLQSRSEYSLAQQNKTNTLQGLKGSTSYVIPTDRSGCSDLASSVPDSRDGLTFNDLDLVLEQTPDTVANAQRLWKPGSPTDPSKANDRELLWI